MARAVHDYTFPLSGSSFSISNFNNAFNAPFQGDIASLRPRASNSPNMTIVIAASDVEGYYRQAYSGNDSYNTSASGTITFVAPSANPRIDLIHTSGTSGLIARKGTEAASPVIPFMPSGVGYIPVCAVYHKTTETKIVNYEDQAANPNEGYIYRDLRPVIASLGSSSTSGGAEDIIVRGFELANVAVDDTTVTINPGTLYHSSIKISKTSVTTLTFATAGHWYDGNTHSYSGGAGWCYIGVDAGGNIKLLHTNAPNYADTNGNTTGTKYYYLSGSTYYRVIGAFRMDTDDKAAIAQRQSGNMVLYEDVSALQDGPATQVVLDAGSAGTFTAVSTDNFFPSVCDIIELSCSQVTGSPQVSFRPTGSSVTYGVTTQIYSAQIYTISPKIYLGTGRQFDYKLNTGSVDFWAYAYYLNIR